MRVRGTRAVKNLLDQFGQKGEVIVESLVMANANQGASMAKQKISTSELDPNGKIAQSISAKKEGKLSWSISVNELPMGAYVEFGTGIFVDVPAGWEKTAMQFYVNGKGYTHPHPFLIPTYYEVKKQFSKDVDDAFQHLVNEFNRR